MLWSQLSGQDQITTVSQFIPPPKLNVSPLLFDEIDIDDDAYLSTSSSYRVVGISYQRESLRLVFDT